MKVFMYRVARDFGFAPNPFHNICTLATCKQKIREHAQKGDWIFGLGTKALKRRDFLIYAMRVNEKLTFNEYWKDEKFQCKKPLEGGSLKIMYGDNIYHQEGKKWIQSNSHHSCENGKTHKENMKKDLSGKHVLISHEFYYFGDSDKVKLPELLGKFYKRIKGVNLGQKNFDKKDGSEEIIQQLKKYMRDKKISKGIHGDPINWTFPCKTEYLQRYNK